MGYNRTRKLGNKITSKKCMTEIVKKGDEKNSKTEGEIIMSRKNMRK